MHHAIQGVDVFRCTDFEYRTGKILDFIYRFVHLIVHYNRLEHFACFCNMDDALLRHIGTGYVHNGQTAFVGGII